VEVLRPPPVVPEYPASASASFASSIASGTTRSRIARPAHGPGQAGELVNRLLQIALGEDPARDRRIGAPWQVVLGLRRP
jgi:hypothetical protein